LIKICYAIGILVLTICLLGCKSNTVDQEKFASDSSLKSWPIFRGNNGLTGVADGKLPEKPILLWSFKTEYEIKSSPVVGLGMVFIGSNDGFIYALDLNDGSMKWQFNTEDDVEAPPLLLDSTIYIGSLSGNFYALNAGDGHLKWQYETGGQIHGSANWVKAAESLDKWILVGSYDNLMYCFDAITGKLQWTFETEYFINGAPATDGENVIFGGCDEIVYVVSAATGKKTGEVVAGSYIAGSAALLDNKAYIGHYGNKLICIDLISQKIIWEYGDQKKGGAFFSSPAVNKDYVIIGSRNRYVHCVKRSSGEIFWKFRTHDDVDSSPVICGNRVVIGSNDGRLYILNLNDGTEKWSYEIGAAIVGCPAVTGGKIFVGAEDGNVYAFGEPL
jgi:outer membrane protein assembly factor BamB